MQWDYLDITFHNPGSPVKLVSRVNSIPVTPFVEFHHYLKTLAGQGWELFESTADGYTFRRPAESAVQRRVERQGETRQIRLNPAIHPLVQMAA